jgi:ubiquinone biosynthesis monooxygenase Coq7
MNERDPAEKPPTKTSVPPNSASGPAAARHSRHAVVALPTGDEPPPALVGDLRSDHAGETGAVRIYQGILAVARDEGVRAFATRHLATEREHLRLISACFPRRLHSRLLPIWHVAGFVTGALPALFGPRAVYATIAAVETFVDVHYQEQLDKIDRMQAGGQRDAELAAWRALLHRCQQDEIDHRDEAQALVAGPVPAWLGLWRRLVGQGSAVAVRLARRV